MALTLTITERVPGVPLTPGTVPNTPAVAPVAGTNQITVTWSKASGQTPRERIELKLEGTHVSGRQFRTLTINWGDGSPVESLSSLGRVFTKFRTHTYTGAGPFTISAEVSFYTTDPPLAASVGITPDLSGNWVLHQVQIEKLESEVLRFAPDWMAVADVSTLLQDVRVSRGFTYKYRVRFRIQDERGAASVTSQFSGQATVFPWA